ncbi:MAG: heavy metal translocating P-type ATPase [Helicobacteraceae bacterium]|nr:heavy metal translocating P-type ATPase [Helicobacteraceae bacterium]
MGVCSHCKLEFSDSALFTKEINGKQESFCCQGCYGVFVLLNSQGLGDFYNKLGGNKLEPVSVDKENLDSFDTQAFREKYITLENGLSKVSLVLEKIHCIACVWLNERLLERQCGITKVNINYTTNKATITFDETQIKLSQIIVLIRSIGYDAHAYDAHLQEAFANKERREYYIKMVVGIFCVMNIMWIAVAQYAGYFSGISDEMRNILNTAGFLLATPVVFYSGSIFWCGAFAALKARSPNMDLLVISGATLAYAYSIYAAFSGAETYFESVAMIITFVLIGKFLEVRGKKSAADALDKINASLPLSVRIVEGGEVREVAIESAKVGDVVRVAVGERVGLDGILLDSVALCDESAINGESLPISKSAGDSIYSGSLVLESPFSYKVSKTHGDSLIRQILNLVEDALSVRPKIAEVANKITRFFSPVILSIAALSFCVWYFYLDSSFDKSLMIMISVIIIACPCALALATPIASLVGLSEALKHKILFKEARFLETISKASVLVVDKTGTLTSGNLSVVGVRAFGVESSGFVSDLNALESLAAEDLEVLKQMLNSSNHPISKAVSKWLAECGKRSAESGVRRAVGGVRIRQIAARGLVCECCDSTYLGGNAELLTEYGIRNTDGGVQRADEAKRMEQGGILQGNPKRQSLENVESQKESGGRNPKRQSLENKSVFYFAKNGEILVEFSLQDSIKKDAKVAINELKKAGISCVMLSGDNYGACAAVAGELGISFKAGQNPLQKAEFIDELHAKGQVVVMAGDGINDALALSKADIAIAMGGGIDLAISVSDVVVLDNSMQGVQRAFKIGRRTYKSIVENLAISLIYNALTIPLAAFGFVIPLIAALSMSLSSLIVVGNSLRGRE